MDFITIDFETYYDTDYSLSKMQTDAYILDDRYQTIGVSVKVNDGPTRWFSAPDELEIAGWLHQFDWKNSAAVGHHLQFDGFIMTQRFGIRPKLWVDTLSLARMHLPYLRSHSLANLAKHFKLPDKGLYVGNMLGRRKETLTPHELADYGVYCEHDTNLTHTICQNFMPTTPPLELRLIDMTIRMFTEPMFVGNAKHMHDLYEAEKVRKEDLIAIAGVTREMLMSNDKMATVLQGMGVEPPTKISAKTGKEAWAFAKSDKAFTELLEHDNPNVQAVVAARLGVKTTIAETRALTMLQTANRPAKSAAQIFLPRSTVMATRALENWPGAPLPVYLHFWGAKTTGRYSGGNKINWQNLPARGLSAGLRDAIGAPPGYKIVVGDSSNIELRVAMAAAGQQDVVDKIASGEDLYCDFAGRMFNRKITKADKKERLLGKIAMLSLQYGAGWVKFKEMVRQQTGEVITDEEAQKIVSLYRQVHHKIVDFWWRCGDLVLPEIMAGCPTLMAVDRHAWCLCVNQGFGVQGAPGVVYHNLRQEPAPDGRGLDWVYTMGKEKVKLYGGKVVENFSQHVARQIVMWQTARINERYPVKLSVHDEAVCVVPEADVTETEKYMTECLSLAPPWCRGTIPLACETGIGDTYGSAK